MKKYIQVIAIIALLFLFLAPAVLFSQTIKGTIIDNESQPIEFANVAIYSLADSSLVTGTVTDSTGLFMLEYNDEFENSFLQVSFIGYETKSVPIADQQTIVLNALTSELGEVIVRGNLPVTRIKNDGLVTSVQNTVLSKAGTGNDVLKRLPSVTGDNGEFSVFGKGEAKIYINNREMRDPSELDRLNSADVKDVEIINNPGAQYDATVKAVIRINTVKKAGDGFSFDVRSSAFLSKKNDYIEELNLNYRKNGWDIFGTVKYEHDSWSSESEMWQETFVDTLWTQENNSYSHGKTNTLTGVAGINYEISTEHYTGIRYTIHSYSPSNSYTKMNSLVLANDDYYDRWESSVHNRSVNEPLHQLNAYYNGNLGQLKVDFNLDLLNGKNVSNSAVTETSMEYDDRVVNSQNIVNNRLLASKLVLKYPVLNGELSLGSEYTDTDRKDEYITEQNIVPSSETSIKEQNNSFFAQYSYPSSIGQLNFGLRYENVRSDYFNNGIKNDEQSKKYDQWFPSISLATNIKNVGLQLSYTAKTKRPAYGQLSSNIIYGNRFTLQTGNPFLKPSTIHNFTLVGVWRFVNLMLSYENEKNAIIYWAEQLEENPAISLINYRNLDELPSVVAFLSVSPTFGIWSPQLSIGFVKQWFTLNTNDEVIELNKPFPIASFNNSFSLPKDFLFTVDGSFQGKGHIQNIYMTKNQFLLNIGLTKSFLDDRMQVTAKGHDLFRGRKDANLLYNSKMNFHQVSRFDSRKFEITVRYKFNSGQSKYKGTGAGQSEIERL